MSKSQQRYDDSHHQTKQTGQWAQSSQKPGVVTFVPTGSCGIHYARAQGNFLGPQQRVMLTQTANTAAVNVSKLAHLPFLQHQVQRRLLKNHHLSRGSNQVNTHEEQGPTRQATKSEGVIASENEISVKLEPPETNSEHLSELLETSDHQRSFHVQSATYPNPFEAYHHRFSLNYLPARVPAVMRPANCELVQNILRLMQPVTVFAQFDCLDRCRSRGICVHYSFLLGCRDTPDGLVCATCKTAAKEEGVDCARICPRHNRPSLSQYVANLPEDFLATPEQQKRAEEILYRSLHNEWEGFQKRPERGRVTEHTDHENGLRRCGYDCNLPEYRRLAPSTENPDALTTPEGREAVVLRRDEHGSKRVKLSDRT